MPQIPLTVVDSLHRSVLPLVHVPHSVGALVAGGTADLFFAASTFVHAESALDVPCVASQTHKGLWITVLLHLQKLSPLQVPQVVKVPKLLTTLQ
jgi:hypothetical protein